MKNVALIGNPFYELLKDDAKYYALKKVPNLKNIDGIIVEAKFTAKEWISRQFSSSNKVINRFFIFTFINKKNCSKTSIFYILLKKNKIVFIIFFYWNIQLSSSLLSLTLVTVFLSFSRSCLFFKSLFLICLRYYSNRTYLYCHLQFFIFLKNVFICS